MAIKETIMAGGIIFGRMMQRSPVGHKGKRAGRANPTIEEVQRNNDRYAERDLAIKLCHNYIPGDIHLTSTYGGIEPSAEVAKRHVTNFLPRLKRLYEKAGITFKYILVTEYLNKRIHHHLIIPKGLSREEIEAAWGQGSIFMSPLYKDKDYRELAHYLIKETSKTFRDPEATFRKRYTCSRNIETPPVYRELIHDHEVEGEPEPIRGYYIDKDSVYRGENPFTERLYVEYIMLPIDIYHTRVRFNNKEKRKYKRENYDNWLRKNGERQIVIDI
ncbi:MAG: hypothetical protein PHW03_05825 [Eubacteriales bacterium]|nr:hypothetical protein [Eubacteriales bacterium]MDD4390305.1 hypothetical protein [Eubacteriales bacterium]